MKKRILGFILIGLFLLPFLALTSAHRSLAATDPLETPIPKATPVAPAGCVPAVDGSIMCLNVPIAGLDRVKLGVKGAADNPLGNYIKTWYGFIIGTIGILATVMIMWGGFRWLTSRGDAGIIGKAKEIIFSAIIGLVLVFMSYTILYLINPTLLTISMPTLPEIANKALPPGNNDFLEGGQYQGGNPTATKKNGELCTDPFSQAVLTQDQLNANCLSGYCRKGVLAECQRKVGANESCTWASAGGISLYNVPSSCYSGMCSADHICQPRLPNDSPTKCTENNNCQSGYCRTGTGNCANPPTRK